MTLASMTGFARAAGDAGPWRFAWELKSVNAKGLDLRLRLSPPFDAIEPEARGKIAGRLARGTVHATLIADREPTVPKARINQDLLRELVAAVTRIAVAEKIAPATLDGLLAFRGVVVISDAADDEVTILQARASALDLLSAALDDLVAMRQNEGRALAALLSAQLERMATLAQAAELSPARKPEAIRARLCSPAIPISTKPLTPGSAFADGQGRYQRGVRSSHRAHHGRARAPGKGWHDRPEA